MDSELDAEKESVRLRLLLSREKFYDNLTLLSGGAIVLSVSLLAALITKSQPVSAVRWLYSAWACLLASLVCATFRNRFRAEHEWAEKLASEAQDNASGYQNAIQGIAAGSVLPVSDNRIPIPPTEAIRNLSKIKNEIWDWAYGKASRKSRQYKALFSFCEWVAQVGFVLGLVLLLGFAIKNAAAYTSTSPASAPVKSEQGKDSSPFSLELHPYAFVVNSTSSVMIRHAAVNSA